MRNPHIFMKVCTCDGVKLHLNLAEFASCQLLESFLECEETDAWTPLACTVFHLDFVRDVLAAQTNIPLLKRIGPHIETWASLYTACMYLGVPESVLHLLREYGQWMNCNNAWLVEGCSSHHRPQEAWMIGHETNGEGLDAKTRRDYELEMEFIRIKSRVLTTTFLVEPPPF